MSQATFADTVWRVACTEQHVLCRARAAVTACDTTRMTRARNTQIVTDLMLNSVNAQKPFIVVKLFKPYIGWSIPIPGHNRQLERVDRAWVEQMILSLLSFGGYDVNATKIITFL